MFTVNDCFISAKMPPDAAINYYIQVPDNQHNALKEFSTLLIDLSPSEECIWNGIYHRTRDEINSFLNNQVFEYKVKMNLSEEELNRFICYYNDFAKRKKIRNAERFRLVNYNKHGILAVSYIEQQNQLLVINFYRVTTERASNLYTFNRSYLFENRFSPSHFGRAHRAIHWLDMMEFKKAGVKVYDFCGWYSGKNDKTLLNINKFKEQFTNYKVKEYSGVIYGNKLLKIIKQLF